MNAICQAPETDTYTEKLKDVSWSHHKEAGTPTVVRESEPWSVHAWFSHVWLQRQLGEGFGVLKSLCVRGVLKWPLLNPYDQVGCGMTRRRLRGWV